MKKLIFDTDPGIDDAMALLLLHAIAELDIRGITTVFGNASIEDCTRNALYICERFKLPYKVYRGAGKGLNGDIEEAYPDFVHGNNGLGDIDQGLISIDSEKESAVDFIIREVEANAGDITILAVGRLTNIALALLQAPGLDKKISEIVLMGGALKVAGNVTAWAEANIHGDPEAAQCVFESGVPLVMVGLDATMSNQMTKDHLEDVTGQLDDAGLFLRAIKKCYLDFHASKGIVDAFPIHDSTAVLRLARPEFFDDLQGNVQCVLNGEQRGRTKLLDSRPVHRVCMNSDNRRCIAYFDEVMKRCYSR
jgi:inosine-uridine nucleoside N-ribohydrolase